MKGLIIMIGYKGLDKDFRCRGFQFEVGKTYQHDGKIKMCESGFHFCDTPLAVFQFYPPSGSRFALVEAQGDILQNEDNHKFCTSTLKVVKELSLNELILAVKENLKKDTGDYSAATNTGDYSAAIATGSDSVAIATGKGSRAKAVLGCWLVLTERDDDNAIIAVKAVKVDGVNILPDTFYTLKDGLPVEVI